MSDTPETDDLIPQFLDCGKIPDVFALARRLERERDEAREQRNCLHELHNKNAIHSKELLELCETLRKERDEAMLELSKLKAASGGEACPKCGAQVRDPFGGRVVVHDVAGCGGLTLSNTYSE
jgi:hypothetical protein